MKPILSAVAILLFSSSSFALLTPKQALHDALAEPLSFVGWYMPKSSMSQKYPNCVWRNSRVLVTSHYCVRKVVPAGLIMIHSVNPTIGYARIYTEIAETGKDISRATRAEYVEQLLSVSSRVTEQTFDPAMTAKDYQKWEELENKNFTQYCVTNEAFKDEPFKTVCRDLPQSEIDTWAPHGLDFWLNSDPNWVKLLKTIKTKVKALPNYPY